MTGKQIVIQGDKGGYVMLHAESGLLFTACRDGHTLVHGAKPTPKGTTLEVDKRAYVISHYLGETCEFHVQCIEDIPKLYAVVGDNRSSGSFPAAVIEPELFAHFFTVN